MPSITIVICAVNAMERTFDRSSFTASGWNVVDCAPLELEAVAGVVQIDVVVVVDNHGGLVAMARKAVARATPRVRGVLRVRSACDAYGAVSRVIDR